MTNCSNNILSSMIFQVAEKQPWGKTIIIIVAVIVIALALLMSIYFIRKFIILRRQ